MRIIVIQQVNMKKMLGAVLVCLSLLCSHAFGQTGLSVYEKEEILNIHNYFRSIVNPIATNMEKMVWNDELAMVAQNYSEQCVFEHNGDRVSMQRTFTSVGENLAASTGPANYTAFVEGWNDEVADYNYTSNSCSNMTVCGHYTQVVWATSSQLGCGAYRCPMLQGFPVPNSIILVCNYGPAGNLDSQRPYSTGAQSCSACPGNQTYCVQNICSSTPDPSSTTPALIPTSVAPTTGSSSLINKPSPSVSAIVTLLALVCSVFNK